MNNKKRHDSEERAKRKKKMKIYNAEKSVNERKGRTREKEERFTTSPSYTRFGMWLN